MICPRGRKSRRWRNAGAGAGKAVKGCGHRIIFGAVGDRKRLEYTVIGDAANLSAKLVKHNKALHSEALTTAETYELALVRMQKTDNLRVSSRTNLAT